MCQLILTISECANCIYNEFGTGVNGSKACKERRRLYLLREGDIFPLIMSLPTGSLKPFSRYLLRCLPKWGASNAGVTRFTLTKAVNGSGIVYTKAQFQIERKLDEQEITLVKNLTAHIRQLNHSAQPIVPTENNSPSVENDVKTTTKGLAVNFEAPMACIA